MTTANDVAEWMVDELNQTTVLYQEEVVWKIRNEFDGEFTYENENGNLAIDKKVLKAFRSLTEDSVVWEQGERCWRKRQSYDTPGRRQD